MRKREEEDAEVVVSKKERTTPMVSKKREEELRRELFPKMKRLGLYRTTGEGAMIPLYDKRGGSRRLYEGEDGIDGLYYEGAEGWS